MENKHQQLFGKHVLVNITRRPGEKELYPSDDIHSQLSFSKKKKVIMRLLKTNQTFNILVFSLCSLFFFSLEQKHTHTKLAMIQTHYYGKCEEETEINRLINETV